jgi:hypothetical protein
MASQRAKSYQELSDLSNKQKGFFNITRMVIFKKKAEEP